MANAGCAKEAGEEGDAIDRPAAMSDVFDSAPELEGLTSSSQVNIEKSNAQLSEQRHTIEKFFDCVVAEFCCAWASGLSSDAPT
ncbi:hypothetical protein [uncultured Pseudacidovorax sp.]|uniref:hypothetical protein n=1 Tax=uncultured Pseudacidovorax sp. TaxID=679313 RepID=UPI0025D6688F|nr:hypothetical protein [uncultured Pseudacidovorax sp.]